MMQLLRNCSGYALVLLASLTTVGCGGQGMAKIVDLGDLGVDMPFGCTAPTPACPSPAPSWSGQISAIVSSTCANCHAPGGEEANMPFTDYEEVSSLRQTVLDQIYNCLMPPPANDLGVTLTDAQRAALIAWLACEAPNN
jgi:mono/diheme cytochrome c family protein